MLQIRRHLEWDNRSRGFNSNASLEAEYGAKKEGCASK